MSFIQAPPALGNTYESDVVLRTFLENHLPAEVLREIEPSLREMGALSGGPLHELLREDEASVPVLTSWDPWGRRIDRIELTRLWKETLRISAEKGLVALPYERRHGPFSRLHQFALVHLFEPSSGVTSCPLAMTDGAAKTLLVSGNADLAARALPRLTARDPARAWTSGQWMTERIGGSDVGASETVARLEGDSLAALRDQVVHVGDDLGDGPDAGASRGEPAGREGPRPLLPRDPRRGGRPERPRHSPAEGQARDADAADRGARPRRGPRGPREGPDRTASRTSRRC